VTTTDVGAVAGVGWPHDVQNAPTTFVPHVVQ
jgi:hypothetical protein